MIGKKISHFKVLEKLGEGGMGIVYKAQDVKLDRIVVLKFLPDRYLSDKENKARFFREAKSASILNHPNVTTIYEIVEDGKDIFIAMEYVQGQSIKERTMKKPFSVSELLTAACQISEGLQAAHICDIIHRDIKSDNILISKNGRIKILDFGLAKKMGLKGVTQDGSTLGTYEYMSPEQIQGMEVDNRSDIFSLGVVMYEMATGKLPFEGEHVAAVSYALVNEDPPSITNENPDVPQGLENIILRALQKDANNRYQNVTELCSDLQQLQFELEAQSSPGKKIKKKYPNSIAVLPFTNLSKDPDNEYFSDGLAEDLINALFKIKNLKVASRTSSFVFKGKQQDIREIGKTLNVETVLEGSVRKARDRLRIVAQLINVSNGYHLWSEKYDRKLKDVFEIQDEITENITKALKLLLSPKEKDALEQSSTENPIAYEYYLQGRAYFHQWTFKSHKSAIDLYKKAIKIDPKYALAYAGIADCHSLLFMYMDSKPKYLQEAVEFSRKALELDSNLSEAHVALGLASSLTKDYKAAEKAFLTAIRLCRKLFEAHYWLARTYFVQGKSKKAISSYKKALIVNPDDFQTPMFLAPILKKMGQKEKAKQMFLQGIKNAEQHLRLTPYNIRALSLGAGALIQAGDKKRGLEWAQRAMKIDPDEPAILYNVACTYSLAGKYEESIDILEKSMTSGSDRLNWIKHDTDLDPLRKHPRFIALIKKFE